MRVLFLFLLLPLLLLPRAALANFISIDVQQEVSLGDEIEISLNIRKSGDDTARELQLHFPEFSQSFSLKDQLAPKESFTYTLRLSRKDAGILEPGFYIFHYLVSYKDKNRYSFSSVNFASVTHENKPKPKLLSTIKSSNPLAPIKLSQSATFVVELRNISAEALEIEELLLATPSEIEATLDPKSLSIAPGKAEVVKISLKNKSALATSNYIAGLISSGEDQSSRFSNLLRFQVHIVENKVNPKTAFVSILLLAGIFLVLGRVVSNR